MLDISTFWNGKLPLSRAWLRRRMFARNGTTA